MIISDVIAFLEKKYPPELAADFDAERIGHVIGSDDSKLTNILLALDLTIDVAKEAVAKGANLIITHHPFIFTPLYKILFTTPKGKIIKYLCQHDISVYVMHTNLDAAEGGVNDVLSTRLGLQNIVIAGGGPAKDKLMRVGEIEPTRLGKLSKRVRERFDLPAVKIVGAEDKMIQKVGIIGGSGATEDAINQALAEGVDCFVTGEIKLHIAQQASACGLALIDVGHGIERMVLPAVKDEIKNRLGLSGRVFVSEINTDPLLYSF
ncbi:MAG TPA: Nif3-like dinuclear metal center hexameric protein [Acholeplasmataceae bacterium]|jgi:dinuclear metal center YbgI/SA1388 family protein|nr:Nif3-like dinuclear metal center hexameric protein [Acholeplasmataceae bacterium]